MDWVSLSVGFLFGVLLGCALKDGRMASHLRGVLANLGEGETVTVSVSASRYRVEGDDGDDGSGFPGPELDFERLSGRN